MFGKKKKRQKQMEQCIQAQQGLMLGQLQQQFMNELWNTSYTAGNSTNLPYTLGTTSTDAIDATAIAAALDYGALAPKPRTPLDWLDEQVEHICKSGRTALSPA